MKRKIRGSDAANLLNLIWRIDEGYTPTIEEEKQLAEIVSIDLSSCALEALPECINKLSDLQSLDVSYNNLNALPDSIGQLSSLQSLDVSNNNLNALPNSIGQLSLLQSLDAAYNILHALPDSVGQLLSLQFLYVSDNKLNVLPDSIGQLSSLQSLDVFSNNLHALPDSVGQLSSLQSLNIFDNKLNVLPDSIGQLSSLQSLNVFGNKLNVLPDSIGQLSSLQSLNAAFNILHALPDSIGQLSSLQSLDVSVNKIKELPTTLKKLTCINQLDVSDNPIQAILPEIFEVKDLEEINLSNLNLHHLPATVMESGLPFLLDSPRERNRAGIYLRNTNLSTQPISLFMQPRELIQAYFTMDQVPVNEGKVIFLGHGDVGKSYTIQRILNHDEQGDYKTNMTPGISISHLDVDQDDHRFNVCFWDFGGQEIMHAMHRCFLTSRTCYVIVVSNRLPDLDGQARYWLRNVESFAGNSDVLLVINRWEDYPSNKDLNFNQLSSDFKNLVGCVTVSAKCDDKQTFHKLTERIIQMASKLDSTGMNFPIQWHNIRQSLMNMAEEGNYYINQDEYYRICAENDLNDANIRMWLLEWFNDLGTCFSYHQDTDKKELEEYKVLNPEWLTNAIYIIILNGNKFTKNGVISHEGIEYLLSNPIGGTLSDVTYTSEECGYILEVMRKFTLSYSVSDTEEFIPALCPNETPENLYPARYVKHLAYELGYTYLPDSVVHQLMIYCYQYLKLNKCWRKGMSLDIFGMDLSAVVNMGSSDQLLRIDVYSYGNSPLWLLLQPLLDAIRKINTKMNLHADDYVYAETIIDGELFSDRYELDFILNVKNGNAKRRPSDRLQGKEVDHSIQELLANLYGEQNIAAAESEISKQITSDLTPSVLAGATLNNCTIVLGNNNDVQLYQGISEEFLKTILNNQEKLTEEFLSELANIFAIQSHNEIKKLGEDMQSAQKERKSIFKVLRDRLDDSEKLTTIAANLYAAWPTIKIALQKVPDLANMCSNLLTYVPR